MTSNPFLPDGQLLREVLAAPRTGALEAIVVRLGEGRHACPAIARLTREEGLVGDRWSSGTPVPERQLTLMDGRVVRYLLAERVALGSAQARLIDHEELDAPGDNLVLDLATAVSTLPPATRLRLGGAIIETNDLPHMGCKKFAARFGARALAWINDETHYDLRLRGLNATVVQDGEVRIGDRVEVIA